MPLAPSARLEASFSTAVAEGPPASLLSECVAFWRQFVIAAFDPYRPELYYMRGPGPAYRAKQRAILQQAGGDVATGRFAEARLD